MNNILIIVFGCLGIVFLLVFIIALLNLTCFA